MNLPNLLTLFRILLVPVFLYFLFNGPIAYALAAFVLAGLTDAVDGALARMTGQITELGILLDPLADKALVLSAFVALTVLGKVPAWLTIAIVLRDAVIVIGSAELYRRGRREDIRPVVLGKVTTFFLFALLVSALAGLYLKRDLSLTVYLAWASALFIAASSVQYVLRGYRMFIKNG